MTDFIKRVRVRWHVVAIAALAALPEILNWLGVIDLRPILSVFLPSNYVDLIVGVLPFALMFVRSIVSVEGAK